MIPYRTPFLLTKLFPSLTWRVPTLEKELYLTFDDGPVPGPTEFVLETLRQANIKATFFCIGDNIRKHPLIFQSLIDSGHTVGNHTYNHVDGWKSSRAHYHDNVNRCNAEIEKYLVQQYPRFFRPPYGRITRQQIKEMNHYQIIMWDVLSMDFNKNIAAETSLNKTNSAIRNGSIIIFHDSLKAEKKMMYMLPRLIDHAISSGYKFKSF